MKRSISLMVAGLLLIPLVGAATTDWNQVDWLEGAAGYAEAVATADESGEPVLVYFYTDWCPYCRQLNESLLGDADVQAELDGMLAVRVNPEAGADERSLAGHYRVRGYPALFVYTNAQGGQFQSIRRTSQGGQLKTPQQFIETLRAAAR